jgi:polysaccharide biosynthesis transport protein
MTIRHAIRIVQERWLAVVTVMVIAVLCAGGIWLLRPPQYTASLTFYVSPRPTYTDEAVLQSTQLTPPVPWSTRITSYIDLMNTRPVREEVVRQLRLSEDPDDLASSISATSRSDSLLIEVAVTDRSATQAAQIANVVGGSFEALVGEVEPRTPDGQSSVTVQVVRPAEPPATPSSPGLPVLLALGLLSGVAIGIGIALALGPRRSPDAPTRAADLPGPDSDAAEPPASRGLAGEPTLPATQAPGVGRPLHDSPVGR